MIGIPYARAGVQDGRETKTCPRCGDVFVSDRKGEAGTKGPGSAGRKYAAHYDEKHPARCQGCGNRAAKPGSELCTICAGGKR